MSGSFERPNRCIDVHCVPSTVTNRDAHVLLRTKVDRDPVGGGQLQWWLLDPHDEVTIHFQGIGLGLLTHVGPDSGLVRCELTRTDGALLTTQVKCRTHVPQKLSGLISLYQSGVSNSSC